MTWQWLWTIFFCLWIIFRLTTYVSLLSISGTKASIGLLSLINSRPGGAWPGGTGSSGAWPGGAFDDDTYTYQAKFIWNMFKRFMY